MSMNTHIARNYGLAALSAKVALGATLALGFGSLGTAHADQTIEEDSPAWSCVDDGNRVCGPSNPEGKLAACYAPRSEAGRLGLAISDRDGDDSGVIVALWPCNPWEPNMGHRHADGTTTYPNGDVGTDDGEIIKSGDHA